MLQVRWSINAGNPNKRKTLACAYDPIRKRQHNFGNEAKEVQQTPSSNVMQEAPPAKQAAVKPSASKPSKKKAKGKNAEAAGAAFANAHADTSASIGAFLSEFVQDDNCLEAGDFCAGFFADDMIVDDAAAAATAASLPLPPPSVEVEPPAECDPLEFLVSSQTAGPSTQPESPDMHADAIAPLDAVKSLPPSPAAARTLATCGAGLTRPTVPGMTSMASMASLASLNTQVGSSDSGSGPGSPKSASFKSSAFDGVAAFPPAALPCAAEEAQPGAPPTASELIKELAVAVAPCKDMCDDEEEPAVEENRLRLPAAALTPADDFFSLVNSLGAPSLADGADVAAGPGDASDAVLDGLCDFDNLHDLHVFGSAGGASGHPAAASAEDFALAGATSCDLPAEGLAQLTSLTAPSLPMLAGLTFTGFDSPLKKRKGGDKPAKPRAPKMSKAAKAAAEAAAEAEAEAKLKAADAAEAEAKAAAMRQAAEAVAAKPTRTGGTRTSSRGKRSAKDMTVTSQADSEEDAPVPPAAPASPPTKNAGTSSEASEAESDEATCCGLDGEPRDANATSPTPCDDAKQPVRVTPAAESKKASSKKGMKWNPLPLASGAVAAPVVSSTTVTSVTTTTTTTTHMPMPAPMPAPWSEARSSGAAPAVMGVHAPGGVPVGVPVPAPAPAASRGMQFTWQPLKIAGMRAK